MQRFSTLEEAQSFIGEIVDRPITDTAKMVKPGVHLASTSIDLGDGRFTNSYDLTFNDCESRTEIVTFDALTSTHDFITSSRSRRYAAATSGGYFYLADCASGTPRQLALNLSISGGSVRSLPATDRETVIADRNRLDVRSLAALGSLILNGHELDWSGSLTDYDTKSKVYSNGNVVIQHMDDPITGSARVLKESSRYTPAIHDDGLTDIGFIGRGNNNFIGVGSSSHGGVDIFAHDFVLRCPERYAADISVLEVRIVGDLALSRFEGGAFSAGPALDIGDFHNHPINSDSSLGSRPPCIEAQIARTALYKTDDGLTHIRLFDGRPGSPTFTGLTPTEVVSHILAEREILWGCFLDSGQTAKLCVNYEGRAENYGNRHYMRWPSEADHDFYWTPETGRPVANTIAL